MTIPGVYRVYYGVVLKAPTEDHIQQTHGLHIDEVADCLFIVGVHLGQLDSLEKIEYEEMDMPSAKDVASVKKFIDSLNPSQELTPTLIMYGNPENAS